MIRSGRATVASVVVACALWGAAAIALFTQRFAMAAIAAVAAAVVFAVGVVLMRRVDPEARKRLVREQERQIADLGAALGKASGGWTPHRRNEGSRGRRSVEEVRRPDEE